MGINFFDQLYTYSVCFVRNEIYFLEFKVYIVMEGQNIVQEGQCKWAKHPSLNLWILISLSHQLTAGSPSNECKLKCVYNF
jgi:hypothetical protein